MWRWSHDTAAAGPRMIGCMLPASHHQSPHADLHSERLLLRRTAGARSVAVRLPVRPLASRIAFFLSWLLPQPQPQVVMPALPARVALVESLRRNR